MKEVKELIRDIRARAKEILFHHRSPIQSRHGITSPICEDILTRCDQALAELDKKCVWKFDRQVGTYHLSCCEYEHPMYLTDPSGMKQFCDFCGHKIEESKP